MVSNATQRPDTRYAHNNGSGGRKVGDTSNKLRFRPGSSYNRVPAKTTASQSIPNDQRLHIPNASDITNFPTTVTTVLPHCGTLGTRGLQ